MILDLISSEAVDAGTLIRDARRRHGVTQRSLARRARTSQPHVARIESGDVSPSVATLDRLLAVMGERLDVRAIPSPGPNQPPGDRAADLSLTPGERVVQSAELSHALTVIAAAPRR